MNLFILVDQKNFVKDLKSKIIAKVCHYLTQRYYFAPNCDKIDVRKMQTGFQSQYSQLDYIVSLRFMLMHANKFQQVFLSALERREIPFSWATDRPHPYRLRHPIRMWVRTHSHVCDSNMLRTSLNTSCNCNICRSLENGVLAYQT